MVINQINVDGLAVLKPENHPPVAGNGDGIKSGKIALQLMKLQAGNIHILNWFRQRVHDQGGGNYQTLINAPLRTYVQHQDRLLEETLRRVIREELGAAGPGS